MAGNAEGDMLSLPALQAHPLIQEYFPSGLTPHLLKQQLSDPALVYLDLDELCEMDEETLRTLVHLPSTAEEDTALPSDEEVGEETQEGGEEPLPQSAEECIILTVNEGGLQAKMKLISPPEGIPEPGKQEMLRTLFQRKITRGVRLEFLTRLAERPIHDQYFRIAEAQLPVDGQDASVTFHFNPYVDMSPRMLEDGTADYKDLDFVKSVQAGDLLCEITPATPGQDGVNIYGQPIPAAVGRPPAVRSGANTLQSADGREIRATCDGQVFLRGETVEVSQILILDTVDYSTGNVDFPGSVHIRGDVSNGFTVRAEGDIVVRGVVENATLIAGGSIALCSGIKGGGGGSLEARRDVRTLFIESCQARAGGNIYADTILNSTVECGGLVSIFGKRGYLLGGVCVAGESVSAVQIGNDANAPTSVILKSRVEYTSRQEELGDRLVSQYEDAADRIDQLAAEEAQEGEKEIFARELARMVILSQRLQQKIHQVLGERGLTARPRRRRTVQAVEALFPNVSLEIDGVFAKNTSLRGGCTVRERQQKLYITETRR